MLPSFPPLLAATLLFPVLMIVAAIGLFTGWLSATILRTNYKGLVLDAVLAPVVLGMVFAIALKIPWHGSYVEDGWTFHKGFSRCYGQGTVCSARSFALLSLG